MSSRCEQPESICILRLSALGDVTHVLPVLHAIRQRYPDASITWVCGKLEHRLLQHVPGVRFLVFDKSAGVRAYLAIKRQLAGERFDVLLHMQVAARANLLSMLVRADDRVGWDRAGSRDLHHWFIDRSIEPGTQRHQVASFLAFARAIGIDVRTPVWNLPVTDDARSWLGDNIEMSLPTLVISPCSSHPLRNWTVEGYAAVADYAAGKSMQVVLSGGPGLQEREMGEAIENRMSRPVINLVGKDTLQQLVALLSRASVVLTPDSGPAHIANAVGTKVLGLYACTNPLRSGPYSSLDYCVNRFPQAAEQFAGKPVEQMRWGKKIEMPGVMELITVDEVIAMLDRMVVSR